MKTYCKCFTKAGIFILLCIGTIFVSSLQAEKVISSKTVLKDIQDKDLVDIEKLIGGVMERLKEGVYRGNVVTVLETVEKLRQLRLKFASSVKIDRILFLSGRAKVAMGRLLGDKSDLPEEERVKVEAYYKKHKDDYEIALGAMYKGKDFQTLIKKYPGSSLAPEAAFIMATEHLGIGECESDMNCHLHRSINGFSSFIKKYPNHPKASEAINEINSDLRRVTWNPKENGLWEIFDIAESTALLKNYHAVAKKIPDTDMREESLYLLARAYISVGQFELADQIYNDLESHYPKYRNAKTRAAYLVIDYNEQIPARKTIQAKEDTKYAAHLSDSSEKNSLEALDKINRANISERSLLFSLLMTIGNLSEKDTSPVVRKRAIEVIGDLAPQTSFFRSVVGYCLLYDRDKNNRYYCADLGVNHPDLKSTDFYAYNSDRINTIISETTGKTYPSEQLMEEWQNKAIQKDMEAAEEILRRAKELRERK